MIKLSNRLEAVAALVKSGERIADIGTDHGYLPVFLCRTGKISNAIASDINVGPLNSCLEFVRQEGLEEKIQVRLSDGLEGFCEDEFDTVIIAGMGGELIADILAKCNYLSKKHIILNPMTHPELARKFLFDNGFEIVHDLIVQDKKHHYSVFDAFYSGVISPKSKIDYYLGNISDFSDKEYFIHLHNYLKNKSKSGEDFSDIINALEEII